MYEAIQSFVLVTRYVQNIWQKTEEGSWHGHRYICLDLGPDPGPCLDVALKLPIPILWITWIVISHLDYLLDTNQNINDVKWITASSRFMHLIDEGKGELVAEVSIAAKPPVRPPPMTNTGTDNNATNSSIPTIGGDVIELAPPPPPHNAATVFASITYDNIPIPLKPTLLHFLFALQNLIWPHTASTELRAIYPRLTILTTRPIPIVAAKTVLTIYLGDYDGTGNPVLFGDLEAGLQDILRQLDGERQMGFTAPIQREGEAKRFALVVVGKVDEGTVAPNVANEEETVVL